MENTLIHYSTRTTRHIQIVGNCTVDMHEHSSQFRTLKKDNLVHLLLVFVHVANVGTPDPSP